MRWSIRSVRTVASLLAGFALIACGRTTPSAAARAADAQVFAERSDRDGKPGWLSRGSGIVDEGGGLVFYGVGIAAGVSDPAVARSSVDNRARAEIGKLVEVSSAALMKDYLSASSADDDVLEEQAIEQAITTASSTSLVGSEIVDRYYGRDGTIYALARLDVAKMQDALARAAGSAAFRSYVEEIDIGDIAELRAANVRLAPTSRGDDAPGDSGRAGGRPAWIDGEDPRFARNDFLCGVGAGPSLAHAENGALAALSRIFRADVRAASEDFMGAYQSTGAPDLEVQWTESETRVATSMVLRGVELRESWEDEDSGTRYGLACLERRRISAELESEIREADAAAEHALNASEGGDPRERFAMLAEALQAIMRRQALNAELRIVKANGVGIDGPASHADVAAAFAEAQAGLKVAVVTTGARREEFAGFLEGRLTERGYRVSKVSADDLSDHDVVVDADIQFNDVGVVTPADGTYYVEGVVNIEVRSQPSGKVLKSLTKRRREGRKSKDDAERIVAIKFARKYAKEIGEAIDSAMKAR